MPFVRRFRTIRSPSSGGTTTRIRGGVIVERRTHSHSQGGSVTEHNCRPSTKNCTAFAATLGSIATLSMVTPLTYASADGELMITGDAALVAGVAGARGAGETADDGGTAAGGSCGAASISTPAAQASSN